MSKICKCCQREPATMECQVCKRWICLQCQHSHNCYPRRFVLPQAPRTPQ